LKLQKMKNLINLFTYQYWGLCPECWQQPDVWFNYHRSHVCGCRKCKTAWIVGWNLFSSWQHEDESVWEKNLKILNEQYRSVQPFYSPISGCSRLFGIKARRFVLRAKRLFVRDADIPF
jgi:hypothetical protein